METLGKGLLALLGGLVMIAVIAVIMAVPTLLLWNWVCVKLFSLPVINFWEALGITLLCNVLFKGSTTVSSKTKE